MSLPLTGRRIGLLTASATRAGGGVFEAVVAQAALIRSLGAEALVFALDEADVDAEAAERDRQRFGSSPVSLARVCGPRQIGFAPKLIRMLIDARLDCLHLHGIWMYPSRAGSVWARLTGRPYLISPHGMLDPWITARGRWKKALARLGYERTGWARAGMLHALTAREAADIRRETGRDDSVIIPNALPFTDLVPDALTARPPVVAYLGRIHPKKNLIALVNGWRQAVRPVGARLVIAGWGDAPDVEALRRAIAGGDGGIEFIGPVFGGAKAELLQSARFMVLPSLSEGLPMAMLEAWASATPTIMTAACNLDEAFAAGAAIESGYSAGEIAAALGRALSLDERDWQAMAQSAHELAKCRFAADVVAGNWLAAYNRAIEGR